MLDTSGRVIYVGSFSKSILATLRVGFIVAPPSLNNALRAAKFVADWHTSLPLQAALADFIAEGLFARHVRRMRRVYEQRHDLVRRGIQGAFAHEFELVPSSLGLHMTILARSATIREVEEVAKEASLVGVETTPLSAYVVGSQARAGIILGYGAIATDRIEEGLERLRRTARLVAR